MRAAIALLEASMNTCLCGRGSLGGQMGLVHSSMFVRRCSQYVSSSITSGGMFTERVLSHPFLPFTSEQMNVYKWRRCRFTSEPRAALMEEIFPPVLHMVRGVIVSV